jgi:hypothetical protein
LSADWRSFLLIRLILEGGQVVVVGTLAEGVLIGVVLGVAAASAVVEHLAAVAHLEGGDFL